MCVLAYMYSTGYVQNEAVDVLAKLGAKCTIWEAHMEGERWRFAGIDEDPRRDYTTYATHANALPVQRSVMRMPIQYDSTPALRGS